MTLCNSAAKYQHFREIYCFYSGKESGAVLSFETLIPTYHTESCHSPQYDIEFCSI
jgi:hypothetical protein